MKFATAAILLAVTALSACSGIPRRESDAEALARYTAYAGKPIPDFKAYSSFNSWSPIDDHHLLIETNVNEAYLLTVFEPCTSLPFATHIGIISRVSHTVSAGFDSVRVGRERCRISEIRPVDYRRMRADQKEEREARKEKS